MGLLDEAGLVLFVRGAAVQLMRVLASPYSVPMAIFYIP